MQMMFNPLQIGGPEWLWIILLGGILLFGTNKAPEMARSLGKVFGEFQKGRKEIDNEIFKQQEFVTQTPSKSLSKIELQKSAAALGIDTVSKSEEEIRLAIKRKLDS